MNVPLYHSLVLVEHSVSSSTVHPLLCSVLNISYTYMCTPYLPYSYSMYRYMYIYTYMYIQCMYMCIIIRVHVILCSRLKIVFTLGLSVFTRLEMRSYKIKS